MHKKQCSLGLLAALLLASAPAIPAKAESIPAPEKAAESALPGLPQQTFRCSLIVVDDQGQPVIGASILEKGTASNGTITDINGHAQLSVQKGAMLIIRYVGYKSQEVKAAATVHVVMQEAVDQLQEVVVVGYGTQKRVNLTGSVSTVDVSKTLEARPEADLSKALQGAVPGLTVLNSTGALGAEPVLTIRGTGTLSNDAKSAPLIVVDGVPMDDISFLNTQDIQSISVLKDAASTSIYGTRAAFGVILITTKAAKKTDHVRVNYTGNFGWDTPSILPNYPDVPTQIRALGQANARVGATNELFGMDLDAMLPKAEAWEKAHNYKKSGYREMVEGKDFDIVNGVGQYYADWDVVGIMFRKWKPSQSHNISVQGTTGKTSYYLSFGYNREEGVMTFNPGDLNKYTGIANLTTDVNKWLQVGARFNFSQKNVTQPNTARYTYQYMWRWGSFFGPYGTYNGYDFRNDIAYRKQAADENDDTNYTRATGFLKLTPFKNFTLNADYTYNTTNRNDKYSYIPVTAYNSWGGNINNGPTEVYTSSRVYRNAIQENSYAFNAYANYNWSFLKKNTFNFMLGINAEEGEYENSSAQRLTLLDPTKPEFSLATGDQTVSGSHTHWGVAGYFGRINYNYNNIWLLELNGRYDGSSRFPKDSHWAFFPSGSLGYRMSEENYFAPLKNIVSNLKIRGSWGEIGNQAVGNNMFLPTMSLVTTGSTYWLDGSGNKVVAYNLPKLVSPTLTWERVTSTDIGLDLGVINNELNATFDWYQRGTSDMLAPGQTLPQVLGADAPYTNAGALRTRGWDLSLNWHHDFNGVQLYASADVGNFSTVITRWDNDSKLLNQNYSGKHYGDIWGFVTDRLFTKDDFNADGSYKQGVASQKLLENGSFVYGPGDIKFKDLNGDGKIDVGAGTADDHGDLKVIGNTLPRYQYSFRLGGNWKGFDLDAFFQGVGKRDVWTQSSFVMPFMRGTDAIYANETDYYTDEQQNYDAYFPRLYGGNGSQGNFAVLDKGKNNFYPQTRYLVHMAYLRFKNLTVGYSLPAQLLNKAKIERVRFYISAENLCELINRSQAPVDPEINTSESTTAGTNDYANGTWGRTDPMYRTVSFGVQLTF